MLGVQPDGSAAGTEYVTVVPETLTEPTLGCGQLGVGAGFPDTVSVKFCVPPRATVAEDGEIEIEGAWVAGLTVTCADPDFVVSSTLVAVTVTFVADATDAGAVYKPEAETVPGPGVLQVTDWLGLFVPFTTAVNWSVPPAVIADEAAETVTEVTVEAGGFTVTVTDAGELLPPAPEQVTV